MPEQSEPTAPAPDDSSSTLSPSLIALVLANLWPLVGVLFFGWTAFSVMILFWMENVIVGVFNVARLWMAGSPGGTPGIVAKVFAIPFFMVHYGMFTAVHGLFVFAMFSQNTGDGALSPDHLGRVLAASGALPAAAMLAVSHGYSFVTNYLGRGEFRTATIQSLMMQPYARVVVLHVVIIFGGFLIVFLKAPAAALALLVVLKIGMDVSAHRREHGGEPRGIGGALLQAIGPRRRASRSPSTDA
jgi:hypothetical protein